jgi:hypothetical protein
MMLQGGKCFQRELPAASSPAIEGETEVLVECNDCLVAAERLVKERYNPVLLNFASVGILAAVLRQAHAPKRRQSAEGAP